jgi:serine/threonine-protein kinase
MAAPPRPSVATLFGELAELAPSVRAERLRRLAGDAPDVAREVGALLDADAAAGDFLRVLRPDAAAPPDGGERPADALREGARVGPYRAVRELGSGGMATVWLAHDDRLDRPVALKFLRDGWGDTAGATPGSSARARFVVEARAAAALDHPHIAPVYDVGEAGGGRPYIAMAYCAGGSLADRLAAGGSPRPTRRGSARRSRAR